MITSVSKILKLLEQIAPLTLADKWDNSGLLIGNGNREVDRILIALDLTEEVLEEALEAGFDLIITHHPLIFNPIKQITTETRIGKLIIKLIENRISLISLHTNMDRSFEKGINRYVGEQLELEDMDLLVKDDEDVGYGVVGNIKTAQPLKEVVEVLKEVFNQDTLKLTNGALDKSIKRIAFCSGAGADFIDYALNANADLYITSDIKHHESQLVNGSSMALIDVGHYESESVFLERLKALLDEQIELKNYDVYTMVTETEKPQFKYV
ncbi:Nif3-like dinuclear metal center hexameric protein [Fusibacter ferrireducens]|uniref:GTP cyclohydrolase 1 type 2 homolog n=1 Tax=Fusibacter ferrireducens TaxID=2785058 RepID=A0ABR9ZPZ2_9FIRM|nr:Nif3-like dinuclear metal center hexameric protein [Fusibacter ferrireducens]MBF4692056.1 Nif3-like dinuclear metal center hexameric protein [Fusibacter ferrireducens]